MLLTKIAIFSFGKMSSTRFHEEVQITRRWIRASENFPLFAK